MLALLIHRAALTKASPRALCAISSRYLIHIHEALGAKHRTMSSHSNVGSQKKPLSAIPQVDTRVAPTGACRVQVVQPMRLRVKRLRHSRWYRQHGRRYICMRSNRKATPPCATPGLQGCSYKYAHYMLNTPDTGKVIHFRFIPEEGSLAMLTISTM